jgi:hypothetical protein
VCSSDSSKHRQAHQAAHGPAASRVYDCENSGAIARKAFSDRTKAKAHAGQAEKERFTLCENLLEPYAIKLAF